MISKNSIQIFLLVFYFLCTSVQGQQTIEVGIPTQNMNFVVSSQDNSNWCWAACIEMLLNYYGINISQEQIVYRSYGSDPYGNLPNWTGNFQLITSNLNNWSVDNYGKKYQVSASLNFKASSPIYLINELRNQRPVLIGYSNGPRSGHAVLITAVSYVQTSIGPQIQTITVRDPWPSEENIITKGKKVYIANQLANRIMAHWYVRVY